MNVTIVGSGNGGLATAFDFAVHGHTVRLSRRSTIDMVGPGLTLFLGPDAVASSPDPAGTGSAPVTTVPVPATAERALGIGPAGAVLVRPDGLPVASRWTVDGSPSNLIRAIDSVTAPPQSSEPTGNAA